MKKISKLIFASAALLAAFVSCQKVEEISEAPKTTHIVRFTTEMPTKTSYVVDGNSVKYSWEEADIANLKVFEDGTQGEITNHAITDGVLCLEVSFTDSQESSHIYTAYLNGAVKSEQVETGTGSYDPTCDVLVAKPVQSSELGEGGAYTFSFRRPVAITELKLKGLTAGEKVSKVTIISDSEHPIAGKYTQSSTDDSTGDWSESSNKIVVSFGESKTVDGEGVLNLSIVTRPIKEASVKVLVETENGLKYRKVTASALTLLADVVKAQGIGLTPVTEAEHAEDGWYLVTDANELFDGDKIRIACTSKNMMAGDFAVDENSKTQTFLTNCEVSFNEGKLTGVTPGSEPQIFTLAEGYDKWNITTTNGKLGATAVKKLAYNSGTLDWGISIGDEGVATISSETDGYGDIKYNNTSPRFLNYASEQTDIQIFKKYGTPEDPVIKIARTASFSPETATVTIDANDNVFPELSFEPEEATGGEQTWTSSNTDVATVNATTGEVTLVSDGTTTISVEIGESETYQPCSASYELTVKPAEVAGVDYLDRDWTGVSDGATTYAEWSDKVGSSGNTYAGNSAGSNNAIQLRSNNNTAGIVVTNSASNQVARKVTVDWESHTSSGRTLDIYGKSSAYTTASDLYSSGTQGTKIGSIVYDTSTELAIEGDYKFIGIRSNSGALYLNWIKIQWEDPKSEYEACFKDADGNEVTEINATVGSVFTAPTLYKGETQCFADNYASSDTDVATVNEAGTVTLKKKGDAIITATLNGDETHRKTEVPYTIHVANVLSSIEITTEPTKKSYYVGDEADYSGIAVTANYNDNTSAEIAADKLNFSGFDSSEAVAEQAITVSYTENDVTKTASYNVEIKAATTLYDIDVTGAADANGNSVTVEGSKEKAEEGDEITLNVNLATGYKLTSLKVNDVEHSADVTDGKYTFIMPAEAITVTASFDNHYNVVLGSATNGSFTVNGQSTGPISVVYGTTVNLVATPSDGYIFKTWTVEGATVASATAATTTLTMPANEVTVSAEFEQPKDATYFHESFNKCSGTGGNDGSWSGSIAQNTLTADIEGWTFANESGASACAKFGTGSKKGSAQTPSINISTSTAKLMFKAGAWNGNSEGNTLNLSATGAELSKSSVPLAKGSWTTYTVDVTYITGPVKIKFEAKNASNNRFFLDEVYVYYGTAPVESEPTEYNVNIGQNIIGGTVSASPTSAAAGTEITLTATPADGYSFSSWDVKDALSQTITVTNNKFEMPASNVTVSATFTETGGSQGGTEQVYKTAKFGSAATSGSSNNYTSTFTSTADGFSVDVSNGNTNNTTWDLVKFGRKNYDSVGSVTTSNAIDKAVTKVTIDISAITTNNVNSITLYSGTSAESCTTNEGTFTKSIGEQTVSISNPAPNKFYKVEFNCSSASSNGIVAVKTVKYYAVY